jgi:hypothetical protein
MNSQDLHNLQEAYMGVYEEVDTRRAPKELLDRLNSSREGHMAQDGPNRPAYDARQRLLKKAHKRKEQKEQTDLYDIILTHLLDEGYADTQEQAEVIMVNMSEEWRQSICEEYKKLPVGKMIRQASNKTIDALEYQDGSKETPEGQDSYTAANRPWDHLDKMQKIANNHNPAKSKRKEDDNRREGGRKREAGRPRRNELQDNW